MRYLGTSVIVALLLLVATPTLPAQENGERRPADRAGRQRPTGDFRQRRARADNAPKLGETAPNFTLKSLDGKRKISLASFKGKQPVVLIFGSYT